MPLFALICRDKPGRLQTRMDTRDAHLAYIRETGLVRLAGPLIENDDMCGSLIVLEADDLETARGWANGDPYSRAGLFDDVQVLAWKKVIG